MDDNLQKHFGALNLDIRQRAPGFSRFMDQKLTPDVLQFTTECIESFYKNHPTDSFTNKDIEHSEYFIKNVVRVFGKPSPRDTRTKSEYDKIVAQPVQTLLFANILQESKKRGRANTYIVTYPELLNFIASKPQNSYWFLYLYVTKVLQDSGFYSHIEVYKSKFITGSLTKSDYVVLRELFVRFMLAHTRINTETEIRRIFPKVLNVIAAEHRLPGSMHGRMTDFPFLPSDLVYNKINFRDRKKSKSVSRQEFSKKEVVKRRDLKYRTQKAKRLLKKIEPNAEVKDQWSVGAATQIHHIFPENEFPQFADRLENLIRLTPTQHNTKAHPNNNTGVIDFDYQCQCLLEKINSIEESEKRGEQYYSKESFVDLINAGLKINLPLGSSYDEIRQSIKQHYRS